MDLSIVLNLGTFHVKKGLNKVLLSKTVLVEKTKFIGLYSKNPISLVVDDSAQSLISDYYLDKNFILKIDLKNNFRFCFRALIEQKYYTSIFSHFENFEHFKNLKTYKIRAEIEEKNFLLNKQIDVEKCNY